MLIPVILGTAREGRASEHAAKFVLAEVASSGHETELVDVRDYSWGATTPPWANNSRTKGWQDIATRADGFIIVSPEYNHGYPGELKMLLDGGMEEYRHKPVGICGVSSGGLGGARMVEQLRLVTIELGMYPTKGAVYFSSIGKLFGTDGAITDESYQKRVQDLIKEVTA